MSNVGPATVLVDADGHIVGLVLDGSIYRLQTQAKIVKVNGDQINPATEDTLALIKNTDGIKKITDPLPAGTNEIGKVAQGSAGATAWKTDGSGVTQPVSATALPLPAGAATETTLGGVKTGTDKIPADPAREGGNLATLAGKDFSTQTTLAAVLAKLSSDPATQTTLAAVLAKLDVALSTRAVESGGNLAALAGKDFATQTTLDLIRAKTDSIPADPAKESGKLTSLETILTAIRDTAGVKKITDPLPTGTNEVGKVAQGTKGAGGNAWPTTLYDAAGNALLGQKTMAASTPIVVASDQSPIPVTTAPGSAVPGIGAGYVTTSVIALAAVRATAYTEQTADAQRSIASASANDAAAGTGARTVRLTYYTAAFAGPYTEDLTLNGTTGVNTVATNICYIEKIEVLTAGSGGSNAGIITLYSAINKGGVAIGTVAIGDNRTFWAHHYIPTGKVLHITSMCLGHNGTTTGSGGLFHLRAKALDVANAIDNQISDYVRLYGQSSTVTRSYGTPIKVSGPARVSALVLPESSSSVIYRAAFDYYEDVL